MKQYLLFAGDMYYPGGGWEDFMGDYDTSEDARIQARKLNRDWWQVVNTITAEIETDA